MINEDVSALEPSFNDKVSEMPTLPEQKLSIIKKRLRDVYTNGRAVIIL